MAEVTFRTHLGFALPATIGLWLETFKYRGFELSRPMTITLNEDTKLVEFHQDASEEECG